MEEATAILERDVESVRSAWLGSLPAFGAVDSSPDSAVECMSSSGLMAVNDALAQTRRDLDALHIRIAGAIAHRSAPELGRDGMAKQQGYRNAAALIAAATGGSGAEAARLICVGVATAERSSFSGQRMAPRHPHVAEAMKGGCLSLDSAAVITEMLDRVAPRADHEESMKTERTLARRAPSLSLEQVRRLVKHAEAKLDTDGVPEREDALATASWSADPAGGVWLRALQRSARSGERRVPEYERSRRWSPLRFVGLGMSTWAADRIHRGAFQPCRPMPSALDRPPQPELSRRPSHPSTWPPSSCAARSMISARAPGRR